MSGSWLEWQAVRRWRLAREPIEKKPRAKERKGWGRVPRRRPYYGWVMVTALAVTEVTSWGILYYAFSVLLVPMERELGWSRTTLTAGMSLALLMSGLVAPLVGHWLDRHGPRVLMTVGSIGAVGLVLAWSRVESQPAYFIIWAGIGLVMAATFYEPAFVVVTNWFERDRDRALLLLTIVGGFASTIFMPLTAWLVIRSDWRDALVILAVALAIITVPPHALLLRRRPEDVGPRPDGLRPDEASVRAGGTARCADPRELAVDVTARDAMRQSTFWWLTIAFVLGTLTTVAVTVHLLAYLLDRGYSPAFAATVAGAYGALSVLGRVVVTGANRYIPRARTTTILFSLQSLALVVLLGWRGAPGVVLFVAFFGASAGALTIARAALIADYYGRQSYGAISGSMSFFSTVARAAAPVGAGAAYALAGGYGPVFGGLAVAAAVATGAMFLAERSQARVIAPPFIGHSAVGIAGKRGGK